MQWPTTVQVGLPFEVRASWSESDVTPLEPVPVGALPAALWAPFEATALGPAVRDGDRIARDFELVLLDPPLEGAQFGASLSSPGAEVWLRPIDGGAVEVRRAAPTELPLTAQVADAELVRFERLPWDFTPPAAPTWPLWLAVAATVASGLVLWPRWRARVRARRERRAPLRAIEAWLSGSTQVDGAALHTVSGHLRALAQCAAEDDPDGFTVEEARTADAPRAWSPQGRHVLWSWWSADQRWSYGGQLPAPDEARALTDDLEQVLPELREQVEVHA
ncbi:MAG: hypothetical protein ACYS26_17115 [Planctomycetota bacterium]